VPGYSIVKQTTCQFLDDGVGLVQYGSSSLKKHLRELRENGEPEVHERVDLRAWTALGVGGTADLLVRCRSAGGLQRVIDLFAAHGLRWLVLGAGSRLVPPDRGLRAPVVNLSGNLGLWELDLDGAVAGGGANLAQVCRAATRTGLTGMEGLLTASSSVGGAVHAAVHGILPIGGIFDWIDLGRPGQAIERIRPRERKEGLAVNLERRVVVRARLQLADAAASANHRLTVGNRLARLQRMTRSTAPCFASPVADEVENLLRKAGCPGMAVGGVRLMQRFPNRLSTTRSARASDVAQLVREILARVEERTGVTLRPTLCFVDENGRPSEP